MASISEHDALKLLRNANMASTSEYDALNLLRSAIGANTTFTPGLADPSTASTDLSLAQATHLHFSNPHITLPLGSDTRFVSNDKPFNLRSIYFGWMNRESSIQSYNAAAAALNVELQAAGVEGGIRPLAFVERLGLITWLDGTEDDVEYIKPLASAPGAPSATQTTASQGVPSASQGGRNKTIDPRLQEIYNGERKTGDRNSVLRGIKPTDFSHVRKSAATFIKHRPDSKDPRAHQTPSSVPRPLPITTKPTRRPDPIILVSPSASALLRMSNIKSFLETGVYLPADSSLSQTSSSATLLHLTRVIPSIFGDKAVRFIVVDSPEHFKPEYWGRVVAVLTTGQVWQFKNYKWSDPAELFRRTLGVYVGWRGEQVPEAVRNWGRGVMKLEIDNWTGKVEGRWRDREVVEQVWRGIEETMRSKGWTREAGPQY